MHEGVAIGLAVAGFALLAIFFGLLLTSGNVPCNDTDHHGESEATCASNGPPIPILYAGVLMFVVGAGWLIRDAFRR